MEQDDGSARDFNRILEIIDGLAGLLEAHVDDASGVEQRGSQAAIEIANLGAGLKLTAKDFTVVG